MVVVVGTKVGGYPVVVVMLCNACDDGGGGGGFRHLYSVHHPCGVI
jgi:hypothetical protein